MTAARFTTLTFDRHVAVSVETLWQAWTAPAARAIWAPPAPGVTVEFSLSEPWVGGRELSVCRAAGHPDVQVEAGWLDLTRPFRSVNYEVVTSDGARDSAALVTADFTGDGASCQMRVTVQLASLAMDMEDGYRAGFGAGLDNLAEVAGRTMLLDRVIAAPVAKVWGAWMNPETLPKWWGPDGFSCKTARIALGDGGEWVFDMIGPDGTVFPNHHRYGRVHPQKGLSYTLHWGENGPKHADAWASFEDLGPAGTRVTLGMVFATQQEFEGARGFGAVELGLQTLGKLARFVGAP